ncbi:MAG TPA: M48 family metalloprotease [Alphaproteobacteria bacterium]|nr:M48 family metalloprotease [Alphaproteobacteria bacterium]HNS44894.1 M48 family metalloprotease [Alphaproteobacteria bacterium]
MDYTRFCKNFLIVVLSCSALFASGCSVNPATGRQQFTGLMSAEDEKKITEKQHKEMLAQNGGRYDHKDLAAYVNDIGQRLAQNSERKDVSYRFTIVDSSMVNAFAMPGGYIYVSRGLLALVNDEDELAGVLGHEIGHVTARHSAERHSEGMLIGFGADIVGAALGNASVAKLLNVGTGVYMKSYTREQESEADRLGLRYMSLAGYDPTAMPRFFKRMEQFDQTRAKDEGVDLPTFALLLDHPLTPDRIAATSVEMRKYPKVPTKQEDADRYLSKIRGMTYGDSAVQGFVRNHTFYHPELGFAFSIPDEFHVSNWPSQIVVEGKHKDVFVMDMADKRAGQSPADFLVHEWLKGEIVFGPPETMTINGLSAATLEMVGKYVSGTTPVTVRLVAIEWGPRDVVRFLIVYPTRPEFQSVEDAKRLASNYHQKSVDGLKHMTYSFRRMSESEKRNVRPFAIQLVVAKAGDTVSSLARQMRVDKMPDEWFRALNGIGPGEGIVSGRRYKIVQ